MFAYLMEADGSQKGNGIQNEQSKGNEIIITYNLNGHVVGTFLKNLVAGGCVGYVNML